MSICEICGEEFNQVTVCEKCGERFCAECGDVGTKLCEYCVEDDDIIDDDENNW